MTKLEDLVEHPLAVVCHDAGSANLIVEWLKEYKGIIKVCMVGPAKSIWEKHFPDIKLNSLDNIINDTK